MEKKILHRSQAFNSTSLRFEEPKNKIKKISKKHENEYKNPVSKKKRQNKKKTKQKIEKKIKQIKLRKVKNRRARTRTLLAQEIYFLIFFSSFCAFFSFHPILVVLLWGLLLFFCLCLMFLSISLTASKTHSRSLGLLLVLRYFLRT